MDERWRKAIKFNKKCTFAIYLCILWEFINAIYFSITTRYLVAFICLIVCILGVLVIEKLKQLTYRCYEELSK